MVVKLITNLYMLASRLTVKKTRFHRTITAVM